MSAGARGLPRRGRSPRPSFGPRPRRGRRPGKIILTPPPAGPPPRLNILTPPPAGPPPRLQFHYPAPAGLWPRPNVLTPPPAGASPRPPRPMFFRRGSFFILFSFFSLVFSRKRLKELSTFFLVAIFFHGTFSDISTGKENGFMVNF